MHFYYYFKDFMYFGQIHALPNLHSSGFPSLPTQICVLFFNPWNTICASKIILDVWSSSATWSTYQKLQIYIFVSSFSLFPFHIFLLLILCFRGFQMWILHLLYISFQPLALPLLYIFLSTSSSALVHPTLQNCYALRENCLSSAGSYKLPIASWRGK